MVAVIRMVAVKVRSVAEIEAVLGGVDGMSRGGVVVGMGAGTMGRGRSLVRRRVVWIRRRLCCRR
jgi:hypothetical protein